MSTAKESLLLLLDSAPLTWTSQEDRHLLLCRELVARGVQPVVVFSAPLKPEFEERFLQTGAVLFAVNFQAGSNAFYRALQQIVRDHKVTMAHIIFFDYFSPVAWIVRATGVTRIIYEMQNSGIFRATSWKKVLLRMRTAVMTAPVKRFIAISEFVKEQLVRAGVAGDKITVRYLGIDNERFQPNPAAKTELSEKYKVLPEELIL